MRQVSLPLETSARERKVAGRLGAPSLGLCLPLTGCGHRGGAGGFCARSAPLRDGAHEVINAERGRGTQGDAFETEVAHHPGVVRDTDDEGNAGGGDRKSTRLNSSHVAISYAVFCLKKKKHR